MMNVNTALTTNSAVNPQRWIDDGRALAKKEGGAGVFDSIEHVHAAELSSVDAMIAALQARGAKLVEEYQRLQARLVELGFDAARHLREIARGRVDLWWAIGLTILNGVLAMLVLTFGGGSTWMTGLLALLVLTTALPIEEFFTAYEDKASFREALFLLISVLVLAASFWLGTLRGLFIVKMNPEDIGPATDALRVVGTVLRYALGVLSMASEILAGYKLFSVRHRLFSATARAAAKSDAIRSELVGIQTAMKAAETEPGIRRDYRIVGARQYLAEAARGEAEHAHLRRALVGAAIALLVLIMLLFAVSKAAAESVSPSSAPKIVLLDLTKSSTADDLQDNIKTVEQIIYALADNSRIMVAGISDAFGRPRLLLDKTLRGRGSFGLELQAAREVAVADWRNVSSALTLTYDKTSLLGTIQLLPYLIEDGGFDLVILSDAREDALVDLDHVPQIDVRKVMDGLRRKKVIAPLSKVRVFMLGVSPNGKTAQYFRSLEEFWTMFFSEAGAEVLTFSVGRRIPEF